MKHVKLRFGIERGDEHEIRNTGGDPLPRGRKD